MPPREPPREQQGQQQQQTAPDERTAWTPFVLNCVYLTLTAAGLGASDPDNGPARRDVADKLVLIAEDRRAWLDAVVRNLPLERHARVRAHVAALRDHIAASAAQWAATRDFAAPDFYDRYQAGSVPIVKACCTSFNEGLKAHLLTVQQDAQALADKLAAAPTEQAGRAAYAKLVKFYKELTGLIAATIESIRILQGQETVSPAYRAEAGGFADAFDIENELMAQLVNMMHPSSEDLADKMKEIAQHFSDMVMFTSDLLRSLTDKIAESDERDNYRLYCESVVEAASCFGKCKMLFESEVANVDMHGAGAALRKSQRRRSSTDTLASVAAVAPSTVLVEAAQEIDVIDKALEKYNFTLAFPQNVPDLIPTLNDLQPVFQQLPKRIVRITISNLKELQSQLASLRATEADAAARAATVLQTLQSAKGKSAEEAKTALVQAVDFAAVLKNVRGATVPERSLVLFDTPEAIAFGRTVVRAQDELASIGSMLAQTRSPPSDAALREAVEDSVVLLSSFNDTLSTFCAVAAVVAETESAVYKDVIDKSSAYFDTYAEKLFTSTEVVLKDGPDDGRNWPLLDACRAMSVYIQVATHMVANARSNAVMVAEEDGCTTSYAPPSDPLSKSLADFLPLVRATYHLPPIARPGDELVEEPVAPPPEPPKKDRSAKGIVRNQVVCIEDKSDGKSKGADAKMSKMSKLGISRDRSAGAGAIMLQPLKAPDAKVVEQMDGRAKATLWTDKGKVVSDISTSTGEIEVLSGSLNQLINFYTQPETAERSHRFQATFNLTLATFIDPLMFLHKLSERYNVPPCPPGADSAAYGLAFKYPIQLRVCDVLKLWIARRGHEDLATQPALLKALYNFLDSTVHSESKMIASNLKRCHQVITQHERYQSNQKWAQSEGPIYKHLKVAGAPIFQDMSQVFDARRAAIQMTSADSTVFRAIGLSEFADQKWLRPDAAKVAPRLFEMMESTNRMACFVAKMILKESNLRARRKIVTRFIGMAGKMFRLRNFHSMFGVVTGLKLPAILRLQETWSEVSAVNIQTLEDMYALMNPDNDYAAYRAAWATALRPRIPFIGVVLHDLFRLEAAYRDSVLNKMSQGQIDWTFREELARQVLEPLALEQSECYYRFDVWNDPPLLTSLLNGMDECLTSSAELNQMSLTIEPPFGSVDASTLAKKASLRPRALVTSIFASIKALV